MTWTDRYRERVNAENLARQAKPVQAKVKEILEELETIKRQVYWALDPEEFPKEAPPGDYWATTLIEHAHTLLDLAHEYRQALAANPPPKTPVENDEEDLQSTR